MTLTRLAALLVVLAAVPAPAAAQDATDSLPLALREDRWRLDFSPMGQSTSFGIWHMQSDATALGFHLGVGVRVQSTDIERDDGNESREQVSTHVQLGPGYRWYGTARGATVSFLQAVAFVGVDGYYQDSTGPPGSSSGLWIPMIGVGGDAGIEWFVTDALSLSGDIGASLGYRWRSETYESGTNSFDARHREVTFDIGRGSLTVSLWF